MIVGGTPEGRGVVAAASYEARKYGVIGRTIKQEIRQRLCLVASVGVATNKFLVKIASDLNKPVGAGRSAGLAAKSR